MANVRFCVSSPRNISFWERDDSGYSQEEWAEMTLKEQDQAMDEWLFGTGVIECWVENE